MMATRAEFLTDTSSSEDEADKARLKEAVFDTEWLTKGKDKADVRSSDESKIPSKRPDKETNEDDFDNTLNTTPGFKKHVSRKLLAALDSEIECTDQSLHASIPNVDQSNGVKLFSSSTKFLLEEEPPKPEIRKPVRKRRPPSSSSDSSSEDDRLAEASVTHDFIVQQSNLPYLTNKKPADFVIKQSEKEQLDKEESVTVNKEICNDNTKTNSLKSKHEIKTDIVENDATVGTEKHNIAESMDGQTKSMDGQTKSMDGQTKSCKKKKKKHKKEKF